MYYDVRRNYPIYGERKIKNRSDNNTGAQCARAPYMFTKANII